MPQLLAGMVAFKMMTGLMSKKPRIIMTNKLVPSLFWLEHIASSIFILSHSEIMGLGHGWIFGCLRIPLETAGTSPVALGLVVQARLRLMGMSWSP